jgi:hypothetical protein
VTLAIVISEKAGETGAAIVVGVIFLLVLSIPTSLAIALINRSLSNRKYTRQVNNDNRQIIIFVQRESGEFAKVEGEEAKRLLSGLSPQHTSVIVSKSGNTPTHIQERL